MTTTHISDETAAHLLSFLDDELAFLTRVEQSADRLGRYPIGKSYQEELVDELVLFRQDISERNQQRALTQARLSAECSAVPRPRLSTIQATPEITQRLQQRRREVLRKALTVEGFLRTLMVQLSESNMVLNAVLESVLGSATDTSRYNASGQPVTTTGRIEGRRVA